MTRKTALVLAAGLAVFSTAAVAQERHDGDGRSLMEQGLSLFLEGLQEEMAPTLEGLQGVWDEIGPGLQEFLTDMGPRLGEVFSQVEDWSQYHAPEMLPNGDIIMRRKTPEGVVPEREEGEAGAESGVEL